MKYIKLFLLLLGIFLHTTSVGYASTPDIVGTVRNQNNTPLPGYTVTLTRDGHSEWDEYDGQDPPNFVKHHKVCPGSSGNRTCVENGDSCVCTWTTTTNASGGFSFSADSEFGCLSGNGTKNIRVTGSGITGTTGFTVSPDGGSFSCGQSNYAGVCGSQCGGGFNVVNGTGAENVSITCTGGSDSTTTIPTEQPIVTNTPVPNTPTPTKVPCAGGCTTTSQCASGLECMSPGIAGFFCVNPQCPGNSSCPSTCPPTPTAAPGATNTPTPAQSNCGVSCTRQSGNPVSCPAAPAPGQYLYVQTEGYAAGQCATACLACPAGTVSNGCLCLTPTPPIGGGGTPGAGCVEGLCSVSCPCGDNRYICQY